MITSPLFDKSHPFSDLFKPARYKVYHGGRGSGKSWAVAEALVRMAEATVIRVLCARELQSSIEDSVHRLLQDVIERTGMQDKFIVENKSIRSLSGSEFIFKGLRHNYREIKSTEGIDICWVEEAQTVSRDSWDVLRPTIRKEHAEIWITFNPDAETDPTYQDFVVNPQPNSIVHQVNFERNPYFPDVLRKEMESIKAIDDERYRHIWLGEPLKLSDAVIYKNRVIQQEFETPLGVDYLHGLDFGFAADPTALVRCYVQDNDLYIDSEAGGYHIEIDDTPALLRTIDTAEHWPISADGARPETISYLNRKGFGVTPAKKWAGSVEDGIAHIQGFSRIIVHPRCVHTMNEFRSYKWKVDRTTGDIQPVPVDKDNHYMDALRYALHKYIRQRGGLGLWAAMADN